MSEIKSKIHLCCEKCNDFLEISSNDIEAEIPKFSKSHPLCELTGYINGRYFATFSKINKPKEQKWLN